MWAKHYNEYCKRRINTKKERRLFQRLASHHAKIYA